MVVRCASEPLPTLPSVTPCAGLGRGEHVLEILVRLHRAGGDRHRRGADDHHRLEILHRVERQLGIERLVHRVGVEDEHEGVAVGRALRHVLGADDAGGAGAVLDDELLLERLAELGGEQARQRVDRAARRVGRDELDGLGRASPGRRPEKKSGKNKRDNLESRHCALLSISASARASSGVATAKPELLQHSFSPSTPARRSISPAGRARATGCPPARRARCRPSPPPARRCHLVAPRAEHRPVVGVAEQAIGGALHVHHVLGMRADAAADAEHRLDEERRLDQPAVEEVRRGVEVADVVALDLEARVVARRTIRRM